MQISWVDGKVIIVCSQLEGKVLMQGANHLSLELEELELNNKGLLTDYANNFKCTERELFEAVEECITTLPHEDNTWWDCGVDKSMEEAEEVDVECANCNTFHKVPKEEDPGEERWFCENPECVSAAFRYHVG
jgi:hypothetical protein